jgi:two-component system sensor kinase FixL
VTALASLYVAVYLLLDKLSFIHALQGTEITPWSPDVALLICVAVRCGLLAAPLTIATPWLGEILLRHADPLGIQATAAMASIGLVYTLAGLVLRRAFRQWPLQSVAGFALALAVMVAGALLNALAYSAALVLDGKLGAGTLLAAVRTSWVGDVNGIITWLPLMLFVCGGAHEPGRVTARRAGLLLLQSIAMLATFWLVFAEAGTLHLQLFYLLFVPVVWIALQWGVGVTSFALSVLQLGVVLWVAPASTPESFIAVQLLMIVLAATGQFLAITVSERLRMLKTVQAQGKQLAQLKQQHAVTELSAAIAHELNNPLGALLNYLRSASILLKLPDAPRASMQDTLDKAVGEATRSIEVLKKLRAYFRTGAARRQPLAARSAVAEAIAQIQSGARRGHVRLALTAAPDLPQILADPLQLSVILQNLIGNALESAASAGADRGKVSVNIRAEGEEVVFQIDDNGPGVPEHLRDELFHSVHSSKPEGMGLGLAICRSLVASNRGRIWLAGSSAEGASFAFSIPAAPPAALREPA